MNQLSTAAPSHLRTIWEELTAKFMRWRNVQKQCWEWLRRSQIIKRKSLKEEELYGIKWMKWLPLLMTSISSICWREISKSRIVTLLNLKKFRRLQRSSSHKWSSLKRTLLSLCSSSKSISRKSFSSAMTTSAIQWYQLNRSTSSRQSSAMTISLLQDSFLSSRLREQSLWLRHQRWCSRSKREACSPLQAQTLPSNCFLNKLILLFKCFGCFGFGSKFCGWFPESIQPQNIFEKSLWQT